jgi:hypothetical protein
MQRILAWPVVRGQSQGVLGRLPGGVHRKKGDSPSGMGPISTYGTRRLILERVRWEIWPIIGLLTAFHKP